VLACAGMGTGTCSVCGAPTGDDECSGCSEPAAWSVAVNMIYQPPYSEFGAEYGPRTAGAAHRALVEFETVRYGAIGSPAQWDEHEEPRAIARAAQREAPRKDADVFETRIPWVAPTVPKRELECAMLFWRSRMSVGRIAGHMRVKESTVREWIRRTRDRLGSARRA